MIHVEDGPLGWLVVGGCMSGTIKVADADGIVISVVAGDLKAANAYELYVYSCPGSITIAGTVTYADLAELSGALRCGTLAGILTVTDCPLSGSITIDHDLDGLVWAEQGLSGHLAVGGDVYGGLFVGSASPRDLTGTVEVEGSLRAFLWRITGNLGDPNDPNNTTKGQIKVHGGFVPPYQTGRLEIWGNVVGAGACFVVDYDGFDPNDLWDPNSAVIIGDPNDPNHPQVAYTQNTPELKLYKITECRGDCDNNGTVDLDDVNPFTAALIGESQYAQLFPGLVGSRTYHADTNCDATLSTADVNPFVALVTSGCCDPNCPGCEDQDGGGGLPDPQELAKQLADNIWPELYDDLVAIVAENIDLQPDDESRAYWEAVYAALTE